MTLRTLALVAAGLFLAHAWLKPHGAYEREGARVGTPEDERPSPPRPRPEEGYAGPGLKSCFAGGDPDGT